MELVPNGRAVDHNKSTTTGGAVKSMKRVKVLIAALSIIGTTVLVPHADASITLPKGSWQPCSLAGINYCIESVKVQHTGGKPLELTWSPAGPVTGATGTAAAGKTLPGRWTASTWDVEGFNSLGYDGLYIDAKAANDFVPWVYIDTQPTTKDGSALAANSTNPLYATDLDADTSITVKLRVGDIKPGVTFGVATDGSIVVNQASGYTTEEISGYPVSTPLAKSSKDCTGETGQAIISIKEFQAVVIPQNDQLGFGPDGISGKLLISTNGVCKGSTPSWSEQTKSFRYSASAPKYAADGKTINTGFYHAVISYADAALLWGLTKPQDAATALVVSITTTAGGSVAALKSVSVKNNNIIIDVSGFNFPDPMLDIRLNPNYSSSAGTESLVSKASPKASAAAKVTITCVKGVVTKKITAAKPTCPAGYKQKK